MFLDNTVRKANIIKNPRLLWYSTLKTDLFIVSELNESELLACTKNLLEIVPPLVQIYSVFSPAYFRFLAQIASSEGSKKLLELKLNRFFLKRCFEHSNLHPLFILFLSAYWETQSVMAIFFSVMKEGISVTKPNLALIINCFGIVETNRTKIKYLKDKRLNRTYNKLWKEINSQLSKESFRVALLLKLENLSFFLTNASTNSSFFPMEIRFLTDLLFAPRMRKKEHFALINFLLNTFDSFSLESKSLVADKSILDKKVCRALLECPLGRLLAIKLSPYLEIDQAKSLLCYYYVLGSGKNLILEKKFADEMERLRVSLLITKKDLMVRLEQILT